MKSKHFTLPAVSVVETRSDTENLQNPSTLLHILYQGKPKIHFSKNVYVGVTPSFGHLKGGIISSKRLESGAIPPRLMCFTGDRCPILCGKAATQRPEASMQRPNNGYPCCKRKSSLDVMVETVLLQTTQNVRASRVCHWNLSSGNNEIQSAISGNAYRLLNYQAMQALDIHDTTFSAGVMSLFEIKKDIIVKICTKIPISSENLEPTNSPFNTNMSWGLNTERYGKHSMQIITIF